MRPNATRCTAAGLAALLLTALPGSAFGADASELSAALVTEGTHVSRPIQSGSVPTSAEGAAVPTISGDEALNLVKKYFTIPEGPGRLEAELRQYGPQLVWLLTYRTDEDGGEDAQWIGCVDAVTGRILNVDLVNDVLAVPKKGPLEPRSEEEARSRAWALIQALYPDQVDALEPMDGPEVEYRPVDAYTFAWRKQYNGVPVLSTSVRVSVDRFTLDYLSFSADLGENLVIPDAQASISAEDALVAFRGAAEASLWYKKINTRRADTVPQVKLLYDIDVPTSLDAVSGEFVTQDPEKLSKEVPADGMPLKPASLPLTGQNAAAFSREVLELPDDADMILDPDSGPVRDGESSLYVNWQGPGDYAQVVLDPATGRVLNAIRGFARNLNSGIEEPTPQQLEAAEQEAVRVVQRLYSDLLPELRLTSVSPPWADQTRTFQFHRIVNGVPYSADGVFVSVNPLTGQWFDVTFEWTEDLAVPAPENVITPEEALDQFFAGKGSAVLRPAPEKPRLFSQLR